MHPFLTRLGIRPEVQEFFGPFYHTDPEGNLVFEYGPGAEIYGLAFHRVPVTDQLWIAGCVNFRTAKQVFICSSAMEALSFLHYNYGSFHDPGSLLFLATGSGIKDTHIQWINTCLPEKKYRLVFGNDPLGKMLDLKVAAGIRKVPVAIYENDGNCMVNFRSQNYTIDSAAFSLNVLEKLSAYRFNIRTLKPKGYINYFEQLKASAFQL